MAYERLQIIGNIGSIELKGQNAKPYIKMTVAVDKKVNDRKETVWYQVIITSQPAIAHAADFLALYRSGRRVLVEGEMRLRPYINGSGEAVVERTVFPLVRPQLL